MVVMLGAAMVYVTEGWQKWKEHPCQVKERGGPRDGLLTALTR